VRCARLASAGGEPDGQLHALAATPTPGTASPSGDYTNLPSASPKTQRNNMDAPSM
jgi:hypothetical protein